MKVAAAFLAYNCAEYVTDLLNSLVGQVDVVVASIDEKDTQETKGKIVEWAQARQPKEGEEPTPPIVFGTHNVKAPPDQQAGFAIARNKLFSYVPEDVDWVLWIDADDIFGTDVPLRKYLSGIPEGATSVWLPYLYHRNEEYGDVDTVFYRERILKMSGHPVWKGRCHEWAELTPNNFFIEGDIKDPSKAKLWVDHKNVGKTDSYGRNIALLKMMIEEDPNDIRAILYLGHSLYGRGESLEAANQYELYAARSVAGAAPDERYQALIWAARAWRAAGSIPDSLRVAQQAMMLLPQYQDAYIELSHSYAIARDWQRCIDFHQTALRKQRLHSILMHNPLDYDFNPFSIAHTAYYQMNLFQQAIECVTKCLEYRPNDPEFRWRGMYYLAAYNRAKAFEATKVLARHLLNTNEPIKALELFERAPAGALDESEELRKIQSEAYDSTAHLRDTEVYNEKWQNEPEVVLCTKEEVDEASERYPRMQWIVDMVKRYKSKKVLEVGLGNAVCSMMLVRAGVELTGIDVEPGRVKQANEASVLFGYRKMRAAPEHTTIPPEHKHSLGCHHNPDCFKKDPETTFIIQPAELVCETHPSLCTSVEHEHEEWVDGCEVCGPVLMIPDMEMEAPVSFHWVPIGEVPQRIRELGPFDTVIIAELIEHLLRPEEVLALYEKVNWRYVQEGTEHVGPHEPGKANPECPACRWVLRDVGLPQPRIIITTPDGTWRGPQEVNTHHVRMYSRGELERFLSPRGWLLESTVVAHPAAGQGNLCTVYDPSLDFRNKPPVTIWCGPHPFPWTPDSVNREGLGGSETAVVEVARDISVHGYRCLVYTEEEGIWWGARYRKWDKWTPNNPSWVFISWRHPEVFDNDIQANFKFLWMHDTDAGDALTLGRAAKLDAILVLSKWHLEHLRKRYPFLTMPLRCQHPVYAKETDESPLPHEESCFVRLVVVGDGIDPERFTWDKNEKHARDKNKFIYTSSPDRGLEQLLGYWPQVRERLPEAKLEIFYGWDYYDRMNPNGAFKAKIQKMVHDLKDAGVTWRGRVGQKELAKVMQESAAWLYPGPHPFNETFCIGVVEAQAAGCVPVTRNNGALPETNIGGLMEEEEATPEDWVAAIAEAASWTRGQRKRMAAKAKLATWGKVTQEIMRLAFELTKEATRKEEEREKALAASLAPAPDVPA